MTGPTAQLFPLTPQQLRDVLARLSSQASGTQTAQHFHHT